jgi:hypothetical protein
VAGLQANGITAFVVTNEPGDAALRIAETAAHAF